MTYYTGTGIDAADDAADEYRNARQKFPALNSAHEGYAVILEELDELWEECRALKGKPTKAQKARMRKEAIQIAAMAIGFAEEICR